MGVGRWAWAPRAALPSGRPHHPGHRPPTLGPEAGAPGTLHRPCPGGRGHAGRRCHRHGRLVLIYSAPTACPCGELCVLPFQVGSRGGGQGSSQTQGGHRGLSLTRPPGLAGWQGLQGGRVGAGADLRGPRHHGRFQHQARCPPRQAEPGVSYTVGPPWRGLSSDALPTLRPHERRQMGRASRSVVLFTGVQSRLLRRREPLCCCPGWNIHSQACSSLQLGRTRGGMGGHATLLGAPAHVKASRGTQSCSA